MLIVKEKNILRKLENEADFNPVDKLIIIMG